MANGSTHHAEDQRPGRGDRHLWVPRGVGNAGLLLALALDRDPGHPDNATATARMLGVDRETVRRWRCQLLAAGLALQIAGYLVATDAGRALLRQSSPLPRPLIRGRGPRPTPEILRAAAVTYADAVGWRADRRGCRTDAERALLAGVGRRTVRQARELLVERDLVSVEAVRRGRADLRRARLTDDRKATHGAPMADARAERLAAAAERGRSRLRGGAVQGTSRGAAQRTSPMQSPTETYPMQGPAPRPADGSGIALRQDGCPRRGRTADAGDVVATVLGALAPDRPAAATIRVRESGESHAAATAELRLLAADRGAVQRLLAMPPDRGCAELLALLRVDDHNPRRRAGRALQVARMVGTGRLLAIAADAALGRPRNLAAVVLQRVGRVAAGENPQTRSRADWTLERLLDSAAADGRQVAAPGGHRRTVEPRDHNPHRQIAILAAAEAAQVGDWLRVADLLQRHGLELEAIADRSGVALRELEHRLCYQAENRRAAFAEARTA